MSTSVNIEIDQGSNQTYEFTWVDDSTNLPVDITGYTAKMQVRNRNISAALVMEYSDSIGNIWLGGNSGIIRILFAPADFIEYNWPNYEFDLFMTRTSDGMVTKLLNGFLSISPRVTI